VIIKFPRIGKGEETIKMLDKYPDLQIIFMENLLEHELRDRENATTIDLKLAYLKLKCEFDPDQVVKVLNRYKFPLDPALKICNDSENHLAMAHINDRLGLTEEAVKEYLYVNFL